MKKRLLSLLLAFLLIQTMLPTLVISVKATTNITEEEVTAKLSSAETKWKNGSTYDDSKALCKQCFGFCRELFYHVFNASLPTLVSRENARLAGTRYAENVVEVKHLSTGYSSEELSALLLMAKPGDILIASSSSTNHFVMIRSTANDGSGIYVYDANFNSRNGIRTNAFWKSEDIRRTRPIGVTLYRYSNYTPQNTANPVNTYTITFDANGGTVSPSTKTFKMGAAITGLPTPTLNGYSFRGWSTEKIDPDYSGTVVTMIVGEKSSSLDCDTTLYAFWSKNCMNHTYDAEVCAKCGARLSYDNDFDASAAGTYQVTANTAYIRTGPYQIKTEIKSLSKGETVQVIGSVVNSYGNTWLKTSDGYYTHADKVSLYTKPVREPVRQPIIDTFPQQYNVILDDGSTCSRITVTNGKTYGTLPTPTKDGYTFDGWYTTPSGGTKITSSTTVSLTGDQTLYAHWTKNLTTWGDWSDWSTTKVTVSSTRQVETRQVKVSDAYTQYRYGRYVDSTGSHDCWCGKYLEGLSYVSGSAILQYSSWSTSQYGTSGKGWSCGRCSASHIGADKIGSDGRSWWAEYLLPNGSYYWEESRTVPATYETQYRYRDLK